MKLRLFGIKQWPALGKGCKYSTELAQKAGTTLRDLERFFNEKFGITPESWLLDQRMAEALRLLKGGASVKEVAADLRYKYACHLSRDFKAYYGKAPRQYLWDRNGNNSNGNGKEPPRD